MTRTYEEKWVMLEVRMRRNLYSFIEEESGMDLTTIRLSRRSLLKLGRTTLLLAGVVSLYPTFRFLSFPKSATLSVLRVSKTDLFMSEDWTQVRQSRFWIRKTGSQLEGIWATCTHLGCEVHFDKRTKQWICPCHGSRYNQEGQPIAGPAFKTLVRLKVQEEGEEYLLNLPINEGGS